MRSVWGPARLGWCQGLSQPAQEAGKASGHSDTPRGLSSGPGLLLPSTLEEVSLRDSVPSILPIQSPELG